ncbi:MAG TPA: OmpA family protein [Blastocatellia bacterium]|nr:OmpA family protein [Blastocatellia bacterium]
MNRIPSQLALFLILAISLSGCEKKAEPVKQQDSPPVATSTVAVSDVRPVGTPDTGFDINRAPVANPQLGKFPYVGLIEGYQRSGGDYNKDVAFDRYEFFDGVKFITVEGRLMTIEAKGKGASAYQVFKTYEALVTGLGGVKVYIGTAARMQELKLAFSDKRHRFPFYSENEMGVYVLRTPEKEIWFEAYVVTEKEGPWPYFLTVIEKQSLEVKAALLPAEEMKRELDAKGHVALYINFDFDKADIRPDSQPIIDEMVKLLKNNPGLNLTVEGHTDNVGAPDYNRRLSDARARSVVAALMARAILASRLKAVGHGQDKPIADNSAEEGRAKNRRVELVKM